MWKVPPKAASGLTVGSSSRGSRFSSRFTLTWAPSRRWFGFCVVVGAVAAELLSRSSTTGATLARTQDAVAVCSAPLCR